MAKVKEDPICGVYAIYCKKTNRYYIGKSKNIQNRFKAHRNNLNQRSHTSTDLQRDWDNYGESEFEFSILLECETEAESLKKEAEFIEKLHAEDYGYNVHIHGDLKNHVKNRDEYNGNKLLEYIDAHGYEPDGYYYCFDIFNICTFMSMKPSAFLRWLGIDYHHRWNCGFMCREDTSVCLSWGNGDICLIAQNPNIDIDDVSAMDQFIFIDANPFDYED